MGTNNFKPILDKLERTTFPQLFEAVSKNTMETFKDCQTKGLTGDKLAVVLATQAACDAARKAVIATLCVVYDIKPDPFDPRTHFKVVESSD